MPTRRQARINELLLEELSMLLPGRVTDPRLTDVRITRVHSTQDLSTAKVFYVLAPDAAEADHAEASDALRRAEGHLRHELASAGLRRIPNLVFARDKSFEGGQRVLDILEGLRGSDSEDDSDSEEEAGGQAEER